ncbi:TerC family protein [Brevibacillus ginsengisoli]|uniref:TerC family protein n=1 Tax=Brevibacillus ginsengisoli TaxID=363854 RepID=UPI003CE9679D
MDLFSTQFSPAQFFLSLFSIVIIDLVLAGDNAIVIGMVARTVPKTIQNRVILFGTVGAIIVRTLLILFVSWFFRIPYLLAMGGILLIWIAYNLMMDNKNEPSIQTGTGTFAAIRTIIIADVVMSLDNVLAIAGASQGSIWLVMLGLMISIPVIVWGSTIILHMIERHPLIMYIGSAVLAFTAARMITDEPRLAPYFTSPLVYWGFVGLVVIGVLLMGLIRNTRGTSST